MTDLTDLSTYSPTTPLVALAGRKRRAAERLERDAVELLADAQRLEAEAARRHGGQRAAS